MKKFLVLLILLISTNIIAGEFDFNSWDNLLKKHVTSSGVVKYPNFKKDPKFKTIVDSLGTFKIDATWTKKQKLAFWINAYNIFTIKIVCDNWPLKSINEIQEPWGQKIANISGTMYSLNQIENDILRKMNEPRIHFAIVCASYTCPILLNQAYLSTNIEAKLKSQTERFINDSKRNKISAASPQLSKIFEWFAVDFETDGGVIKFINKYSTVKINDGATLSYLDYNWKLNNKK